MKKWFWGGWLILTLIMAGWFAYKLLASEDKRTFLIGDATYGHHQIEMSCDTCHTSAFGGTEVLQDACMNCHEDELEAAMDSHPRKKFTDPRDADRIEIIDARYCISCHTEHQQEQTHAMGLTLPEDYCYHCHEDIDEERESHQNLAFDSCASAGCHNFHDNRALYEDFLVEHANEPWIKTVASLPAANNAQYASARAPVTADFSSQREAHPEITEVWAHSSHAEAGVDCAGCHTDTTTDEWLEKPGITQCANCHQKEATTYTQGKHGMRLASTLATPLENGASPADSDMAFHEDAMGNHQSCNSCHSAHEFNTHTAAVEACLGCHNDEHSNSFNDSPHGQLWQQVASGERPATEAVSCATCHMPRLEHTVAGEERIFVQHNQNDNLRPNEKMIRPVCMQCHSLEFSIDALADPGLIHNNFAGQPANHVPSVDWALKRARGDNEQAK